jgi:hypothetical protein
VTSRSDTCLDNSQCGRLLAWNRWMVPPNPACALIHPASLPHNAQPQAGSLRKSDVVDPDQGVSSAETPTPRRSPVKFFHAVVFVLTGGLAVVWSRWGLLLVAVGAVIGLVALKAKASTLDMNQERHRLDQLRDDLTWLRDSAEHPDGSVHERLRANSEKSYRYNSRSLRTTGRSASLAGSTVSSTTPECPIEETTRSDEGRLPPDLRPTLGPKDHQ